MDLSDALGDAPPSDQQVNNPWPGQPNQPVWPGQPNQPVWPGQPNQPVWPGQPNQPVWPGQPVQPAWPGQPNQPAWPGQPGQNPPTAPQLVPGPPSVPLTVPYDLKLARGVYDKMLITINGHVKPNAKKITINFYRGSDIALHVNPRFDEYGKQGVVRNSLIGGNWGSEERAVPRFPFTRGKPFEIKILCTNEEFRMAVDKAHLLEFKHRIRELSGINQFSIHDDVTLTSVNVETLA